MKIGPYAVRIVQAGDVYGTHAVRNEFDQPLVEFSLNGTMLSRYFASTLQRNPNGIMIDPHYPHLTAEQLTPLLEKLACLP